MISRELQAHYRTEPGKMIEPGSPEKHVKPKSTRWMIRLAETTEGGAFTPGGGTRTWIWSDIHLHHRNIIRYCHRPFRTVEAMNEAPLTAWKETVGDADTIICGGDIALADIRGARRRNGGRLRGVAAEVRTGPPGRRRPPEGRTATASPASAPRQRRRVDGAGRAERHRQGLRVHPGAREPEPTDR